jgi:hypothetical protein
MPSSSHNSVPATDKPRRRWVVLRATLGGALLTVTSACASVATTPATPPPAGQRPAGAGQRPVSAAVPGIPDLPDVVTVVPFQLYQPDASVGWIYFQAELDGRRGTFSLDTGSPRFWLNPEYLRPSATGGIDTVAAGDPTQQGFVTVHTMHIGTLVQHLDTTDVGPPVPYPTNGNIMRFVGHELGTFGLPAMEPFETIIDYVHQRLILIRLDTAGQRLAAVPAYTPAYTMPLMPVNEHWWGVAAHTGDSVGTLVDTGGADHAGVLGFAFLNRLRVVGFNLRTRQLIVYR